MMTLNIYLVYLGLVLLSLTMKKHYIEVISKNENKILKVVFTLLGWSILIYTLVAFIQTIGLSLGITLWLGYIALAIVLIAFAFTYIPKQSVKLSIALLVLTLIPIII